MAYQPFQPDAGSITWADSVAYFLPDSDNLLVSWVAVPVGLAVSWVDSERYTAPDHLALNVTWADSAPIAPSGLVVTWAGADAYPPPNPATLLVAWAEKPSTPVRVSARHSAPFSAAVIGTRHTAPCAQLFFVAAHHHALTTTLAMIGARHVSAYGPTLGLGARHVSAYGPTLGLGARHVSAYGPTLGLGARHVSAYADMQRVTARHYAAVGILSTSAARHIAAASLSQTVSTRHRAQSALLTANPVSAHHRAHASMPDTETHIVELPLSLIHAGRIVQLGDPLEISCDEGGSTWAATIQLDDPSDYARIAVGDALTLTVWTLTVALIVDSRQHSHADAPRYQLNALSPVARYGAPFAAPEPLGATGMARAVCERLLAQTIDWRIPDWRLPESAAELEDTPLALAQQIVGVVGGRLESRLDGSLIARPAAPISPPNYASASAAHHLTDDSLYSYRAQIDAPQIANRFVVTSGDEAEADAGHIQIDVIADDADPHAYIVRAYPAPFRAVDLVHTGDHATEIGARTEVRTAHQELVEIVAGSAKLRYPVHALTAYRWQYVDLGQPRMTDAQTLTAGDAAAYSLLAVEYSARAWEWRVTNARIETIQFLTVE